MLTNSQIPGATSEVNQLMLQMAEMALNPSNKDLEIEKENEKLELEAQKFKKESINILFQLYMKNCLLKSQKEGLKSIQKQLKITQESRLLAVKNYVEGVEKEIAEEQNSLQQVENELEAVLRKDQEIKKKQLEHIKEIVSELISKDPAMASYLDSYSVPVNL